MMISKLSNIDKTACLLCFTVFVIIFAFFAQAHPIYPFDADDWTYLYNERDFYPSTETYNPTRILPEVLMPLSGMISMWVVYPWVGDETLAVCYTSSFILALLITLYCGLFYRLIRQRNQLTAPAASLLTLIFLAFHFLFFRSSPSDNEHLFYSFDLCCHYNYTIPNLIASCFVLLFMIYRFESLDLKHHLVAKGLLFTGLYATVYSHVFGSIILVAYLGVTLVVSFVASKPQERQIRVFAQRYWLHITVILFWLVGLLFEINGRRANTVTDIAQLPFLPALRASVRNFNRMMFDYTNSLGCWLLFLTVITYGIVAFRRRKVSRDAQTLWIVVGSMLICSLYLVLMGAKSYPYYLLRAMTIFAVPFFLLLGLFLCASWLLQQYRSATALLPFLLLLVFCNSVRKGHTFLDVQTLNIPQEVQGTYQISVPEILEMNRLYIQTLKDANRAGQDTLTLHVPHYDQADNWPLAFYYGKRLSRFLYKYDQVTHKMKVTIQHEGNETALPTTEDIND